jgi:hypothetical protein
MQARSTKGRGVRTIQALHSELQAPAALVFAQPPPAGVEPRPDYSRSYAIGTRRADAGLGLADRPVRSYSRRHGHMGPSHIGPFGNCLIL